MYMYCTSTCNSKTDTADRVDCLFPHTAADKTACGTSLNLTTYLHVS